MYKNNLHLKLRAKYPPKNIDRTYEIYLDRGLLESYIVLIGFGRVHSTGKQNSFSFVSLADAHKFIDAKLKKRLTSEKRIGCNYEFVL